MGDKLCTMAIVVRVAAARYAQESIVVHRGRGKGADS